MTEDARFLWHPMARLLDGRGQEHHGVAQGPAVIADRPSALALAQALASGLFRIGGDADGPRPGAEPQFETLTAGSSGSPRRIRRTHQSWLASFAVNAGLFGIGPGRSVAVLGRLVHSLSLYGAVEALHLGATLHLLDELRPDRQRKELARQGVEVLYATPAQLRLLVEAGGADLPALRIILVGGSKLDTGLRNAMAEMAPSAGLREFYGAAEASFITLASADTPEASVGAAYPGVSIEVRGADGRVLPDGIQGEIWVQSPYLFLGYAGNDPGGAVWHDGWLSVGEIGQMVDGHLYIAGRAGRMVTVADQNVFPEEIEAFLATLPGVARCAAIATADPLRGMVLLAVVQGEAAAEPAILNALRARFGPLKAPRRVIWRSDWPVLASGKTDLAAIGRDAGLTDQGATT